MRLRRQWLGHPADRPGRRGHRGRRQHQVGLGRLLAGLRRGLQPDLEATEVIEVVLLDHAEVCRLCDNPGLAIDAKAWGVLHLYKKLGRLE